MKPTEQYINLFHSFLFKFRTSYWSHVDFLFFLGSSIFLIFILFIYSLSIGKFFYPLFLVILFAIILFFLYLFAVKMIAINRFFLYLVIIGGFLGPGFLSYQVGTFDIFPYRLFLVILWLLTIINLVVVPKFKIKKILVKNYLLFLGVWCFYATASLIWADSLTTALKQSIFLFLGISVIFFTILFFNRFSELKKYFFLWLFFLIPLILVGVWEHFTGSHLSMSGYNSPENFASRLMPSAVYNNTNDYATYLSLSLPFLFSAARYAKGKTGKFFWRPLFAFFLFLGLYVLLFTSSRFNWAAVLLETIFLFLFMTKADKKIKAVLISVVMFLVIMFVFPSTVIQIYDIFSSGVRSSFDSYALTYGSTIIRYNLLLNGFSLVYNHGGFGVGAGNAQYHMLNFGENSTFGITDPHNWWLEIFINYGILVSASFAVFYLFLVYRLYNVWKASLCSEERMIAESLVLSLVGFLFASCSSSSIMTISVMWFLFAFSLTFLNYARGEEKDPQMKPTLITQKK